MLFSQKFKKLLAVFALLLWVHIDGSMAFAAYQTASLFKLVPQTYSETPPAAADNEGAARLFDRNTETSFAPSAPALVDISLDKVQIINELRIYGPSSYLLTVQKQVNGQWLAVDSLTEVDLSIQEEQWHSYACVPALAADALRLQLVPTAEAGNEQGIREIELWSPGQQNAVRSGQAMLTMLDQGVATGPGRRYLAAPKAGVIGPHADGTPDFDSDNVFRFNLAYFPEQIRRAYLSYDLAGLAHWTSAIRSINEQAAMGGQLVERGKGGRQIEEIAPAWLRQGANQIRFVPVDTDSAYTVSNLQVLIELDNGTNFVSRVSSNMGTATETAWLHDGSTSSGLPLEQKRNELITGWESPLWQQPAEAAEVEGAAAELEFNRLTELTSVGFYAAGTFKGNIRVFLKKQGGWTESAAGGEISFSNAGWYWLSVRDGSETMAVRLLFELHEVRAAELHEVRAAGSSLGAGDTPLINVSYPDAGQHVGGKVYLRGFAPADNGSGPIQLFVGNYGLPHVNGEFEVVADAALATNGTIELMARYPDGTSAFSLIPLRQDLLQQRDRVIELSGISSDTIAASDDKNQNSAAKSNAAPAAAVFSDLSLTEAFQVTSGKDWALKFKNGSQIDIGKGSVRNAVKIKMMILRDRDLPALDAGMVNVTGKAKGFRFLPHGMKFDKKVKIKLPYNKQLIPQGFKDEDVRTYFFDEAAGSNGRLCDRWPLR